MKVADRAWIALAQLQRENPQRGGFRSGEILARAVLLSSEALQPGVQTHISSHNIANIKPQPVQNRMFFRLPTGELRLFRSGDVAHPERHGKVVPARDDLPLEFRSLIDWYEEDYCRQYFTPAEDPVLGMIGVGAELWAGDDGDAHVRRLRDESVWGPPLPVAGLLWERVLRNQHLTFRTATGLPFTIRVDGAGIWFFRDGRRINQLLSRTDFDKAASRVPLHKTSEIRDCRDYAYLFGLLTDGRIVSPTGLAA